jgi:anti-sigma regulatory factor (Ser/Thr protein kinase)/serine/threonine protein phosphatase PrpC
VEAFLIDEWLGAEDAVPIVDEASVSAARQKARDVARTQQMSDVDGARLATMASELAMNQLRHARYGQIAVRPITRGAHRGVEISAVDGGEGIADPTRALQGAPRVTGSLGAGLAALRELADEVDIDVRIREGTYIRARLFDGEAPRRREVGVYGRPYRDEPMSGDHACIFRDDERLVVGVCDGLGHGPEARAAASAAMRVFVEHRSDTPQAIIEACHAALGATRGVVMAVASVPEDGTPNLELAAVGNITVQLVQPHSERRFGASSFVVGSPQRGWRSRVEESAIEAGEVLVLFTDGIESRASIEEDLALLREHPITIAHQLALRFARDSDDVLVLVAK